MSQLGVSHTISPDKLIRDAGYSIVQPHTLSGYVLYEPLLK